MKFILTRHTTTEWNLLGWIQGQTDTSLSPQGRTEAQELGKLVSTLGINFIVSSDLKRANETAEIVNNLLCVPLRLQAGIRECSFGTLEGLTKQQAIEIHGPSIMLNWEDHYRAYDFRPFGGEHRAGVFTRHVEVLNSLAHEQPNKTILLVGHGRGMRTLLSGLGHSSDIKRGEYRVVEYDNLI